MEIIYATYGTLCAYRLKPEDSGAAESRATGVDP